MQKHLFFSFFSFWFSFQLSFFFSFLDLTLVLIIIFFSFFVLEDISIENTRSGKQPRKSDSFILVFLSFCLLFHCFS